MLRGGKIRNDYARDMAILSSKGRWISVALLLCVLAGLPFFLQATRNANWITFFNFTSITIIAVLGLNILSGMAGQISMGHAAFLLVGGYCMGMLSVEAGMPFWLAVPLATLITGILGVAVAVPALRLKGFYVVIVTLAFFYIAQYIIRNLPWSGGTSGIIGIAPPQIGDLIIRSDIQWYFLLLVVMLIAVMASANVSRSRLGKAFLAVRDNETAAAGLGINVPVAKIQAFFIGSLFAVLAGALWARYVSLVRIDQFTIWDSIWFLGMVYIGGAGSTAGAVVGVLFLRLVNQVLRVAQTSGWIDLSSNVTAYLTYILFGLIIILFFSFKPNGLISVWRQFRTNYKRWPFGV